MIITAFQCERDRTGKDILPYKLMFNVHIKKTDNVTRAQTVYPVTEQQQLYRQITVI